MTCVAGFLYRSSTSAAGQSSRHVISPNDTRSSTYDPRRRSSDDVVEQTSFILQLSPTCPCPSSADAEASDDVHLKHRSAAAPASAAAKTAAVGNVKHVLASPLTSTCPHLRCDVGLEEGEYR